MKFITLMIKGCKFSDFCLISEDFTSKYLKMVFEISSLQPFLDGFMINSDFQTRSVYHFRFFQLTSVTSLINCSFHVAKPPGKYYHTFTGKNTCNLDLKMCLQPATFSG